MRIVTRKKWYVWHLIKILKLEHDVNNADDHITYVKDDL